MARPTRVGAFGSSTYEKVKPLPAGKPLAPHKAPNLLASKFRDIPGQGMLSLDDEDPAAITYEED